MSDKTRITPAQEAILNTYTCERLTANPDNRDKCFDFRCKKNRGLADNLKYEAWNEDTDGFPATYYVVKNARGRIVMYFSLKCGTLCDPEYVAKVLERYERVQDLMDALNGNEGKESANEYLERLRTSNGSISYRDQMEILTEYWDTSEERTDIKAEKKQEPTKWLLRVDEAFPAVELVHFCVNDNYRREWKALKLGRGMGEVFFWKFVVPKIMEISRLVGCEYVYLFAADSTPDCNLIRYYENALHFELPSNISGIKPRYDYLCTFMCKRLHPMSMFRKSRLSPEIYGNQDYLALADYQKYFFETFNELPSMI